MKRDLTTPITSVIVAGFFLVNSGCSMVGSTVALPPERSGASANPADLVAVSPEELRSWSRLIKKGREDLSLRRFDMAEQNLLEAFRISKFFRSSDVRRRVSFGNLERLADSYAAAGYDQAATRVLSIIAIESQGKSEEEYPNLSNLLLSLGELQQRAGELEQANASYQRALTLRVEKNGPNSASLIKIYQQFVELEIEVGNSDRAIVYAERCVELTEAHFGRKSPDTVRALIRASTAYELGGHYPETVARYQAALNIQREIEPATFAEAVALNGMANAYLKMGQLDDALESVALSLAILEGREIDGVNRALILDTKAQILAAQGETQAAGETYIEVMTEARSAPAEHARTLYTSYEKFLRDQGMTTHANQVREQLDRIEMVGTTPRAAPIDHDETAGSTESTDQADQTEPLIDPVENLDSGALDAQFAPLPDVASPPPGRETATSPQTKTLELMQDESL